MTQDNKKKIAADCFRKGNEAMERGNFDYAVKMHTTAVQLIPDNLMFRQTLRGCERRMYRDNKSGAKMASIQLMGLRSRIKKARSKSDWAALDQLAEEGLKVNPWDAHLNADMAEACLNLGYTELAEYGFRLAVENDPGNREFLRKLAEVCKLRGSYSGAIECWKRIQKLEPNNAEARSMITGLQADAVIDRGGYDGAKNTQDVRRTAYDDYRPATEKYVPDTVLGPGVSLEADLQHAIRKNSADRGAYIKLAELYQRKKEFAKAAEVLQQALDASGGDYGVREILEDNDLARLRHELELAKSMAASDPASKKMADSLKRELHLREIEVYSSRVKRYPMDATLKYQLATRYMKSKEYQKAIPLLQGATADQRREAEVRVALGKCFIAEKQLTLAHFQIETATKKVNPHDNAELYCEAHYYLGRLCEGAEETEKAEAAYNSVLSVNYDYQDTRKRLEQLQQGHGQAD